MTIGKDVLWKGIIEDVIKVFGRTEREVLKKYN